MRILERYIFKSVITVFISCIFVFCFLYVIIDLLSYLEQILKYHTSVSLVARYYLSYLPAIFVQASPFACLLSTLYTFGKLNHTNEIIAMRASGLSIFQLIKTVVAFGLMVSLTVLWMNVKIVPKCTVINLKLRTQIDEGTRKIKEKKEVIKNLSMYGLNNRLFFINKFSASTSTMEGIIILEQDEHQNVTKKIVANKGIFQNGLWKFYQSITYTFDKNGGMLQEPQYYEEEIMAIPETPQDFLNQRQQPDFMTVSELQDYIWKLSKSGAASVIRGLRLQLYQRFTTPFTNVIIIFLGVPFAFKMRRRATGLSSIGLSIAVGFLYYILDAISIALGNGGLFSPLFAASLTHIVALATGIYLIRSLP